MRRVVGLLVLVLLGLWGSHLPAELDPAREASRSVERIERLLQQWQYVEAKKEAEKLLMRHPDLPAVQFIAGWVKFHMADHVAAKELADRAAAAFSGKLKSDLRLGFIRAAARITKDYRREVSDDRKVEVLLRPGADEILVPYLFDTVQRTLKQVGQDLNHQLKHPVIVEILPDSEALSDLTGLTVEEIKTTGIIAVCKYGRLMLTSPRATLKGYGWLDTVSHELVHMLISQKSLNQTPVWLHEAIARLEEDRWRHDEPWYKPGLRPISESALAQAIVEDQLVTFEQMHPSMALLPSQEAAAIAYAEVYMAARFFMKQKGYLGLQTLLEKIRQGQSDMQAISSVYGLDKDAFVKAWMNWMKGQNLRRLKGTAVDIKEDPAKKESYFEKGLGRQKKPELRDFFHLGQLLRARGHVRASAVEYQKAVDLAGDWHSMLWALADKLGLVLMMLDQPDQARRMFQKSLKIRPQGLEAHLNLARIELKADPYLSFLHAREGLRLNPLDPRIHEVLVNAAAALTKQKDVRSNWSQVKAHHKWALRLIARGASLKKADQGQVKQPDGDSSAAYVKIHTQPWAKVWLDGKDTGLTSPVFKLEVQPGPHVIGLEAACAKEPLLVEFWVLSGQTQVIDRVICQDNPN
jgi:tetratricopeptide (TPR) repeat protein